MKTLKQELQEVYFTNGNHLDVGSVITVLKEWLRQEHLNVIGDTQRFTSHARAGAKIELEDLMEALEQ